MISSILPKKEAIWGCVGSNFSGRTKYLDHLCSSIPENFELSKRLNINIGPEIYNSISGLSSTIVDEFRLHSPYQNGTFDQITPLIQESGLDKLLNASPFEISGGEQACLVMLSSILMRPQLLALDCALEQVAIGLKSYLLEKSKKLFDDVTYIIADNRIKEIDGVIDHKIEPLPHCSTLKRAKVWFEPVDLNSCGNLYLSAGSDLFLENISFGYSRNEKILKKISFEIKRGEIYILEGKNGAGKSTLAKIIAGVLKPASGKMYFNNKLAKPWLYPGKFATYHFQNPDLQFFSTTVGDEIFSGLKRRDMEHKHKLTNYNAIIKAFGLTNTLHFHPFDLPFSMRKRLAMAAVIVLGSEWIILDEPTLGQDDVASLQIANIIKYLSSKGLGVILISHSPWFKSLINGKILSLSNGQIN